MLAKGHPHLVLLEGNDPRLIDVAVLSRLPLGAVTSWQHATHPLAPGERVFSPDLLEVEVNDLKRRRWLLTLFTHPKSRYVQFGKDEQSARPRRTSAADRTKPSCASSSGARDPTGAT